MDDVKREVVNYFPNLKLEGINLYLTAFVTSHKLSQTSNKQLENVSVVSWKQI